MKLVNLMNYRSKLGINQTEMAKKLGMPASTYSCIENGFRGLSYEMAVKIANQLNTTPDELFLKNFKEKVK